jgi:FdhE protein
MAQDEWQRRIERARELAVQYPFAAELMRFYEAVGGVQKNLYADFADTLASGPLPASSTETLGARPLPEELIGRFPAFLSVVEEIGPGSLRQGVGELRRSGPATQSALLTAFWESTEPGALPVGSEEFCARAFLQPFAALIRSKSKPRENGPTLFLCRYCQRRPGLGVLRPLGDGAQRFLLCSFCLAEWEFRRIICPGCGEEDHAKLPVFTADELQHVRVEACESCKTYLKTVDMTRMGRAEPIVDEMAAIPLDLWAQQQSFTKLQPNLLQL